MTTGEIALRDLQQAQEAARKDAAVIALSRRVTSRMTEARIRNGWTAGMAYAFSRGQG